MVDALGLDLSLAKAGVCDGESAWKHGYSLTKGTLDWASRGARVLHVAAKIADDVDRLDPRVVVVEGPSYGSLRLMDGITVWDSAGLSWLVIGRLQATGRPHVVVSPNQRAQYATGNGSAGKREVLMAVRLRWPQIHVTDDNEADAVSLAAMGCHWLGRRLPTTPVETLDGLAPWMDGVVAGVRWPDLSTR